MKSKSELSCRQVARLLPAFVEQGLPAAQAERVAAHLQQCASCRAEYEVEMKIGRRLAAELRHDRSLPSADASARMRSRLQHKIRRERIMVQTTRVVRGTATLAILVAIVALFAWWQRPDAAEERPEDLMPDSVAAPATARPTTNGAADVTPRPTVPAGDRQPVRMAIYPFEEPRWRPLASRFEEENPSIDIQFVYINDALDLAGGSGWSSGNSRLLAAQADVLPAWDLFALAEDGLLLDLQPLLGGETSLDPSDFYPGALESQSWQGGLWALPSALQFDLILYDKDAFAAAGLPEPAPGWTWDDFLTAASALTGDEHWGFVPGDAVSWSLLRAYGGPPIDSTTLPPQPRMDSAPVIAAVRWYDSLVNEYHVVPLFDFPDYSAESYDLPGYGYIYDGRAGMWEGHLEGFSDDKEQMAMRDIAIGAAPMPVAQAGDRDNYMRVSSQAISASAPYPDAAWRWLVYLSGQIKPGMSSNEGDFVGAVPARRSVAEASGYWSRLDEEVVDDVRFALEHSTFDRSQPAFSRANNPFLLAVEAVVADGQAPEVALAQAQAEAALIVDEEALAQAQATPVAPVAPPTPAAPGQGATTIVFYSEQQNLINTTYRRLAERFQAEHPGLAVEVRLASLGDESFAAIAAQADCFQAWPPFLGEQERNLVLNLDPFLDADPTLSRNSFYPLALASFTQEGHLWGLPRSIDVPVLAYRPALFDAAGVPYPQAGWTPEEFLAAAAALSSGEGEARTFGFVPYASESSNLQVLLGRLGVTLLDEELQPPGLTLNSPATADALAWYVSFSEAYGAKPVFNTSLEGADSLDFAFRRELVADGRAAMWISDGWRDVAEDSGVSYAPLPARGERVPVTFVNRSGYFISAGSEQRDACWQWLRFLSGQAEAVESGLPARPDVTAATAYQEDAGASLATALETSVLQADIENNGLPGWLSVGWAWLTQAYGRVIADGAPVAEVLDEAQRKADAYRNCVLAGNGVNDQSVQGRCLREVDDSLPSYYYGDQ